MPSSLPSPRRPLLSWVLPWPLPWPLPAVGAWLAAWAVFAAARAPLGAAAAGGAALLLGGLLAWRQRTAWRRALVALGFPLSALASGLAAGWPAWAWLLPLALLASAYPLRAWRDAPLFPTPPGALVTLAGRLPLPAGAAVLDAGCGLGDGLLALRQAWPAAQVHGVECSALLALGARARCRWARVRRGDMWAQAWAGYRLVYLFQRPESMARAWAKAQAEMAPGSWLVSLEFNLPGRAPDLTQALPGGRAVHAWRVPPQSGAARADIPR